MYMTPPTTTKTKLEPGETRSAAGEGAAAKEGDEEEAVMINQTPAQRHGTKGGGGVVRREPSRQSAGLLVSRGKRRRATGEGAH